MSNLFSPKLIGTNYHNSSLGSTASTEQKKKKVNHHHQTDVSLIPDTCIESVMDKKATNILEGEASESDEELSDYPSFVKNTMTVESPTKTGEGPSSSIVVSGEAEESDEEDDEANRREFLTLHAQPIGGLEIREEYSISVEEERQKFESPFHRKIYETNFGLRLGIVRTHLERYDHVMTRLKAFLSPESRSQNYIQDALKQYRTLSVATKQLNDNLESLLRQKDLPRLKEPFPI